MKVVGVMTGVSGRNYYFENNNRNKRGLTLDVKKDKGKEIVYRLVEKSDVFVQNFRVGVAAKLGLDYETLHKFNPRLIYANATGFGRRGPQAMEPAFDALGLARSGMMTTWGEPDMPPLMTYGAIADQMGAVMLAYGVMAALLARERLGIGQEVDASLLGSMVWLQSMSIASMLLTGRAYPRTYRSKAGNPLWNYYQCSDGRWIMLANLQSGRQWSALCKALGTEHLEKDPRFAELAAREKNAEELISIMDHIFITKPQAEWMEILKESGDIVCCEVNTVDDLRTDPQVLANDYIVDFDHPAWGKVKFVGIPVKFSETPGAIRRPAPEFGQHTEEILMDILGYSWDDIVRLKEQEVV